VNITQEQVGANHLRVVVSLQPDDYLGKVDEEIKSLSRKISIDGFRPGKVPTGITRKLYGNTILAEELNKIISDSLTNYIKEKALKVFGQPLPFQARTQQIDVQRPEEYAFGFELGLMPELTMPEMGKKSFVRKALLVSEEMVTEEIERLRSRFGQREFPEIAGEEDILTGKFEELDEHGTVKDGGISSTSSFNLKVIKDPVAKQLLMGLKKEESTDINIRGAFGGDEEMIIHHILKTDHHSAEHMNDRFRFTVSNIIHVVPANLNQELFDKIYGEGIVTSEELMRERIREEMNSDYQRFANAELERDIQKYLIDNTLIELPTDFLRRLMDENREEGQPRMNDEQFEASVRQIKWDMIWEKLTREYQIEVSEDELKSEARREVLNYFGVSAGYFTENPESMDRLVDSVLQDESGKGRLRSRVLNEKLLAVLRSKVTVEDREVNEHEFFHH
jgi:trigger factor